ncbi:MAG: isoleucine--tRNA ligase [Verrucomicrobia bacterium]|nr:isoleucine--tRNA ligase [Verrucomicrobiota bacterium]
MNYKDTLNLPKTDFPMKANLTSREPEILAKWESENVYQQLQEQRKDAPLFVLHDGPPFANGDVHMGTALNKVLKDLIVKSRAMAGYRAPYVPGWDCHGLPIEFKVVKESQGLSPLEVRERSEKYARKYIDIQRRQFRRLGIFGDWDNPYLTLDPAYEAEILRVFAQIVEDGLVYQSKKPVYWSTGAQTALAEAEIEYKERRDPAIYVAFNLASGEFSGQASVAIWTTTPWTLAANLAVAVHPAITYVVQRFEQADRSQSATLLLAESLIQTFAETTGWKPTGEPLAKYRGDQIEGWSYRHPFLDRQGKIYTAEFVTLDTGTGCVHIAPGHGEDDYQLGLKHGLPLLSPVDDHGRYTAEVGIPEWVGKYVFDANRDVIALLKSRRLLLGEQHYDHSYPHCWRSKTPVVFRAVEQFFIRVDAIKPQALAAIDQVKWVPVWGRNRIHSTVESRPDWCISRQRSWGVPLPVFYQERKPVLNPDWIRRFADLVAKKGTNIWYALNDLQLAEALHLPAGLSRRNDTLDVWIDSGVSHEAVLKTRPELNWPADVYIEATDQHRGWFQSSLITSVALYGKAPYREVLTHAFVIDIDSRQKLSKSQQGGYVKPTEAEFFIKKYGADLVRLWVASVNFADEVPFGEKLFEQLTDTYRRIRNTLRILLGNLHDYTNTSANRLEFTLIDRWMLSRLEDLVKQCREGYERYEFHKVYYAVNQFCSVDLSSLYIDITKDRMYCDAPDSPRRRATQFVMDRVFDRLTRLLAPVLVFSAEEAWKHFGKEASVHLQLFPVVDPARIDAEAVRDVEALLRARHVVSHALEGARQEKLIGNNLEAKVLLSLPAADRVHQLKQDEVEEFLILSHLELIAQDGDPVATAVRTDRQRCERCWRHRPMVGTIAQHPTLCDRCAEVVAGLADAKQAVSGIGS